MLQTHHIFVQYSVIQKYQHCSCLLKFLLSVAMPPADGAKVMKIGELPNTIPDYLFTKFPLAVILYQ